MSIFIGIVIAVVLLIAAALGLLVGIAIWSACCIGVVNLFRPAGKRARWIAISVPLFVPVYIIALIALVWSIWPDKHDAYATAFGMPPSSTVSVHEGWVSGFADSVTIELYFTATPADIQSILNSSGFKIDASQQYLDNSTILHSVPLQGKTVYTGPSPLPVFESEAVLVVDPVTHEAWYLFDDVH